MNGKRLSWWHVMQAWHLVQADLARVFTVHEPRVQDMPWPWLENLVHLIVSDPDTLAGHHLNPTH